MRSVAASGTAVAGRPRYRHVDYIDMDIGIGVAAVSVGTGFGVGLRFFQIFLLNDFLALDHAASAVGTVPHIRSSHEITTPRGVVNLF